MNLRYNILWIEDSEIFYSSNLGFIQDKIEENNMVAQITYYEHYEEFQEKELDKIDIEIFNLYDQILMDFALSGITGDQIIRDLRKKGIYTDIVFYSSNFKKMQEELKKGNQLDGVFLAEREELTMMVGNVIKKNLKREFNIANIRGLIMDSTSDFDYVCRITTSTMFNSLSSEKRAFILGKAKEYVRNARNKSQRNFDSIDKKKDDVFIEKVINSVDYVMDNKDRYCLMALVLYEFDFPDGINIEFADKYQTEIIKPRNDLAHNKLFYGNCQKKIHIAKGKQLLSCDGSCGECASKYDIQSCENLRKKLFSYYTVFSSIQDEVDKRT